MKKAFTLIEILVVATIIGLLAAGASITYSQLAKQSRDARRKADLEQIRAALEMYRSNVSAYPTTFPLNCTIATGMTDDSSNTYLSTFPKDPKCSTYSYYYESSATTTYSLGTRLENPAGSTCTVTKACGTEGNCNYCLGPYGR